MSERAHYRQTARSRNPACGSEKRCSKVAASQASSRGSPATGRKQLGASGTMRLLELRFRAAPTAAPAEQAAAIILFGGLGIGFA